MPRSILDTIGDTPLVEIKNLNPNPKVRILAKLEYFNPGGSVKDRAALYMIENGEKSGKLTPDKTVIEATSGNTGIGLALVCSVKGYKLLLTMSESVSVERQKILKARGADILLTPGHLGTDGAIEEVYRLARENQAAYFMADQFNNWFRAAMYGVESPPQIFGYVAGLGGRDVTPETIEDIYWQTKNNDSPPAENIWIGLDPETVASWHNPA